MKRESAAECSNPDSVAVLLIFMTLNTQSLRIFAKKRFMYLGTENCFFYGFHEIC